jgi:hypothetical protein
MKLCNGKIWDLMDYITGLEEYVWIICSAQ